MTAKSKINTRQLTLCAVMAAVLTAVFSVMVNIAAHFKLKKVDMVESLKTVE